MVAAANSTMALGHLPVPAAVCNATAPGRCWQRSCWDHTERAGNDAKDNGTWPVNDQSVESDPSISKAVDEPAGVHAPSS